MSLVRAVRGGGSGSCVPSKSRGRGGCHVGEHMSSVLVIGSEAGQSGARARLRRAELSHDSTSKTTQSRLSWAQHSMIFKT